MRGGFIRNYESIILKQKHQIDKCLDIIIFFQRDCRMLINRLEKDIFLRLILNKKQHKN